jgi:hypothetical protein
MEESAFADPFFLYNEEFMHYGNLSGGTSEAYEAELQPEFHCLGIGWSDVQIITLS